MSTKILIDAGPLVALLDASEPNHLWAKNAVQFFDPPFLTCEAVLSETAFLSRHVARAKDELMNLLVNRTLIAEFRLNSEIIPIADLFDRYQSVPMSLADACLIRMSELHSNSKVMTFDSDFKIYRKHRKLPIPTIMPN